MQGAYVDHITSTNGQHFKNLAWNGRGITVSEGVPIRELRERAWEQSNIRDGPLEGAESQLQLMTAQRVHSHIPSVLLQFYCDHSAPLNLPAI